MDTLTDLQKSEFRPRFKSKEYIYHWKEGYFEDKKTIYLTPLQNNDYFSYPKFSISVNKDGNLEYADSSGTVLSSGNIYNGSTVDTMLPYISLHSVAPIFKVSSNFTFVPSMDTASLTRCGIEGLTVIDNSPNHLIIENDDVQLAFDSLSKSRSVTVYRDNEVVSITTEYFDTINGELIKELEIKQEFLMSYDSICYMKVSNKTYKNFQIEDISFAPRKKNELTPNEEDHFHIIAYPNPTTNSIFVKTDNSFYVPSRFKVFNSLGVLVDFKIRQIDNHVFAIDLNQNDNGQYIVSYQAGGKIFNTKFIKL